MKPPEEPRLACWCLQDSALGVMGVPSVRPLPAAASDRAGCPSCCPWGHMLLWTALLVLGESGSQGGQRSWDGASVSPWVGLSLGEDVSKVRLLESKLRQPEACLAKCDRGRIWGGLKCLSSNLPGHLLCLHYLRATCFEESLGTCT